MVAVAVAVALSDGYNKKAKLETSECDADYEFGG
jgi:hypothetical protein